MSAPDAFTRNANARSGDAIESSTAAYPNELPIRIARHGTRLRLRATRDCGASLRLASTNSTREVTYSPEFRHDSTAVRTITFMSVATPGIPVRSSASANGELPGATSRHGTTATIKRIDNT